jgi:hypothetical protein
MNVRAKCVNPECEANGIEKSVVIGQVLGYGAANDRVKCPAISAPALWHQSLLPPT